MSVRTLSNRLLRFARNKKNCHCEPARARQSQTVSGNPITHYQAKTLQSKKGYVLLPVAVAIALVASIAFVLSQQSGLSVNMAASEFEAARSDYVAQAGLQHGLRQAAQQGCGPFTDLTSVSFNTDQYSTALTTDLGATTSYTLNVDQDAWIGSFQASSNHGNDTSLHISFDGSDSESALLRYDLSALPANAPIVSATAWFYVQTAHPDGLVVVRPMTADWSEGDATWDSTNAKLGSTIIATIPAQPTAGVWVPVNLTTTVQAWVNGQHNFGFALTTDSSGADAVYQARDGANPPYLEVITGIPPTPIATLKSVGTLATGSVRSITRNDVPLYAGTPLFHFLQPNSTDGKDSYLYEWKPTWNYGVDNRIWVEDQYVNSIAHGLIRFNVGMIPAGARIISARLELYQANASLTGGKIGIYRVASSWAEGTGSGGIGTSNWSQRDDTSAWTATGGDFGTRRYAVATAPAGLGWTSWEVGNLVEEWVSGRSSNEGLLLRAETFGTAAHFASSDDTDPALRPKISITYSCECGSVCLPPQGTGKVLMPTSSTGNPNPDEVRYIQMLESWGYTVQPYWQKNSLSNFNSAIANNDVVFVPPTANAIDLGTKLTNASIGVVSGNGELNDELGIATAYASPVGSTININDNSHYVTVPFAGGPLKLFSAAMQGLAVAGTPAPGLQALGDWAGVNSPVVIDSGAQLAGGGAAAGRRVLLPFGGSNANLDHINNNGRLLLQRAIAWAMGADINPTNLLFVSGGMTVVEFPSGEMFPIPTAQEQLRIDLMESWGYSVNLISQSDTQANFDSAVANNVVAYIPQGVVQGQLNTRLTNASIGIVNEEGEMLDELGIAQSQIYKSRHEIDIIDNTHYITEPFATGLLTFVAIDQPVHMLSSGAAPGLTELARSFNTGSLWNPSLATLENGAALSGGGTAAGRRVQLPWGGAGFDFSQLTADGQTLMQRALEWASQQPRGPIAHWRLDETGGTTAVDSVGGHNGTLTNGPGWSSGQFEGALDFDGADDFIDVPHDEKLWLTGGMTFMAWANTPNTSGGYKAIISKDTPGNGASNYWFGIENDELVFGFFASGAFRTVKTATANLDVDTWYHLAASFDNATDQVLLYVNGVQLQAGSISYEPTTETANLRIGSSVDNELWRGKLDEVLIYDRALTATEIGLAATPPPPELLAHWKLDETSGTTAVDSVGSHDGTLTNGPAWDTGTIDGALAFDGFNDFINVPHQDSLSLGSFSISAWIYPSALSSWQVIVNKGTTTTAVNYYLATNGSEIGLGFYNAGWQEFNTSGANLTTNQWYHVAATYDNANRTGKIYLDGALVHTGSVSNSPVPNTDDLTIGRSAFGEYWPGSLDDIRLYQNVLSSADIAELYAANIPPAYIEQYQPWSASLQDTWETVDLSVFGVPANSVVEVAIINKDGGKEQFGGVRAVGSTLERRFLLHEAESGGVDAVTMHVQADDSSQIQHYATHTGQVTFVLLGYWTGTTYVERFDAFKAGANASWQSHSLGSYGVAPNQIAEIAMSQTSTSAAWLVGTRRTGSALTRLLPLHEAESGGIDMISLMVESDASSTIEVYAGADSVVDFHLLGYWSIPPGSYTEIGGVHGQASVTSSWQTTDLSGFGVPANAIAQFVLSNENDGNENLMGVRSIGSTMDNRQLNLHEAEAGGGDLGTLHVRADASSQIQWFAEFGVTGGLFYPLGWWVLSP